MNPQTEKNLVTTSELATLCGVNRRTISRWRAESRDVPQRIDDLEDLAAWRAWFAENRSAGFASNKPRQDRESLLCERLEIEIQLRQLQLAKTQGRMLDRAEVGERDSRLGSAISAALRVLERELPTLIQGLPLHRAEAVTRAETRRIQKLLADETSAFWKLHPETE